MTPDTYRASDFVESASRLSVDFVVGTTADLAFAKQHPERYLRIPLNDLDLAVSAVVDFHRVHPLAAVDDHKPDRLCYRFY